MVPNDESEGLWIGITGTPGTGKTTLAKLLARLLEWPVCQVVDLARSTGALGDLDFDDGARPVDIPLLCDNLSRSPHLIKRPSILDGHLSHHLPLDCIIILRVEPTILSSRLYERGWTRSKVEENVEWELLGGPQLDLVDDSRPFLEVDATRCPTSDLASLVIAWINQGCPFTSKRHIDWMNGALGSNIDEIS